MCMLGRRSVGLTRTLTGFPIGAAKKRLYEYVLTSVSKRSTDLLKGAQNPDLAVSMLFPRGLFPFGLL